MLLKLKLTKKSQKKIILFVFWGIFDAEKKTKSRKLKNQEGGGKLPKPNHRYLTVCTWKKQNRTWNFWKWNVEKKVGRENAFTSDFRIFHVSVSRFSRPAFFLSRSILGRFTFNLFCFTFDFRGFHVTFSARSQPKRWSEEQWSNFWIYTSYAVYIQKCTQ